jgi:hypothetical protein
MGSMKTYFLGKLFDINYRIATHEGDANRRLASQAVRILFLPPDEVPDRYSAEFNKLKGVIEETFKSLPAPGLTPSRLRNIRNDTAARYIKLPLDIQYSMDD